MEIINEIAAQKAEPSQKQKLSLNRILKTIKILSMSYNDVIAIFISQVFYWQISMNVIRTHVKTMASVEIWWMHTPAIVPIQATVDIPVKLVSWNIHPQYMLLEIHCVLEKRKHRFKCKMFGHGLLICTKVVFYCNHWCFIFKVIPKLVIHCHRWLTMTCLKKF